MDAYAVLGVDPDADQETLKVAHRRLVRCHHPDLAEPGERAAANRTVQDVNLAYALVRDPVARARYDRLRRRATGEVADAGRSPSGVDLAPQWDALTRAAGRWASRWWRANRGPLRRAGVRAAARARRAGLDLLGRVLWLGACLLWATVGLLVTAGLQRLAGGGQPVAEAAGLLAGGLLGAHRGTRARRRLAGLPAQPPGAPLLLAAACALVALATLAATAR